MSVRNGLPAGILLLASVAAFAASDELPDEDLLEYLGSWEETDEDWLMFEKDAKKEKRKREVSEADVDAKEEESAETKDES